MFRTVEMAIKGEIKASFVKKGNRHTRYKLYLPGNMAGELYLELDAQDVVTHNGTPVNLQFNSIRLYPGNNEVDVVINSF